MGLVFAACIVWIESPRTAGGRWLQWAKRTASSAGGAFSALSPGVLFIVWIKINRAYMAVVDHIVAMGFSLFKWRLLMSQEHEIYYPTFNIIPFRMPRPGHTFHSHAQAIDGSRLRRWLPHTGAYIPPDCNVLLTAFSVSAAISVAMTLSTFGQYALPFLLWWHFGPSL